ncbi:MAG: DUF72 domain-containing protein [Promethearchaeati archaeon SRVP18_Atabeyarchaeia-1]
MAEYRIGAGGWAYFQVPGVDSLRAYSRAFNFVEVNSTFYETPGMNTVAAWRERVPKDFEFSVRCHRDLTHKYEFEPTDDSHRVLRKDIEICRTLHATILQMQTSPSFEVTKPKATAIRDLFESSDMAGIRVAFEVRAKTRQGALPEHLLRTMQDLKMIHCVDLSRDDPAYSTDVVYTRLFGKGRHNVYQFDDKELKLIDEKVKKSKAKKVVLSFHGLKMYIDAARFKVYNQTLGFPPVSKAVGLSSLREVLREDSRFPLTKGELIKDQGWKVFDSAASERIHASEILRELPEGTYRSLDEVITALADVHEK